jgi:uncharacterized protein YggU (UPF0235/DUF167 family)
MMSSAIRFITAKSPKVKSGSIQLLCHVKPGVNAKREGIGEVTDSEIEVCVAAQAREGEANKAVRELIAEVNLRIAPHFRAHSYAISNHILTFIKILRVPKSDVEIAKGMKSREKTVIVNNITTKSTPEEEVDRIRIILQESVTR